MTTTERQLVRDRMNVEGIMHDEVLFLLGLMTQPKVPRSKARQDLEEAIVAIQRAIELLPPEAVQ